MNTFKMIINRIRIILFFSLKIKMNIVYLCPNSGLRIASIENGRFRRNNGGNGKKG